ncbi:MAG: hypothetical protein SWH78_12570 [Thermodesulfobacteriota bacterium]|nr:hypothetical protein [Thermodesulfobacteriota bacterium]
MYNKAMIDVRGLPEGFGEFAFTSAKKLFKLFLGYPLTTPPLGSVTLDLDDVAIAKEQLKRKQDWFNPEKVEEYQNAFASWNGSKYAFAFMGDHSL